MWYDKLKKLDVNIHVMATGAGAGIQNHLWAIPGSSSYLGGASFPYAPEEQEELLGFMPEHFCSEAAAVDLASAAYMKAYKFGAKKAVGLGLAASVASEREHRGDHRVYACIMTDNMVRSAYRTFEKGMGFSARAMDGEDCNYLGIDLLIDSLGITEDNHNSRYFNYQDATALAKENFFARPYFTASGKRLSQITNHKAYALMPGAFNPPHEGHFGIADAMLDTYGKQVVYEVTAEPPHKDALTVQQLLQRAKMLQGYNRIFTRKLPYYLDKARAYPGMSLVLGADAMVRMFDPKWGLDTMKMLEEFAFLGTMLYINGRKVDGKFITRDDISMMLPMSQTSMFQLISRPVLGEWDCSSTEIREKLLAQNK